jgi:DNA-directed RNA polymerase specialized sigma24 family protein
MQAPTTAQTDPRDVLTQDASIGKKLFGYAYKKRGDALQARDDTQEAVARVLEGNGWYRWDPARKSLLDHLCDVVDTIVSNERRRASTRREQPMKSGDSDDNQGDDDAPSSSPNAEQQIARDEERSRAERLAAEVMKRVDSDPLIPRMLKLEQDGVADRAEQARLLHCSIPDIKRARERLAHHRDVVLAAERKSPRGGSP